MTPAQLRHSFSYFNQPELSERIYLDSAATSLKLSVVEQINREFHQSLAANVHRSSHTDGRLMTEKFEQARKDIQGFINANDHREIVWTKGATEGLNLLAHCLGQSTGIFNSGNQILVACSEHHSNIVPWQQLAKYLNLNIKVMPVDAKGVLDVTKSLTLINRDTALVAIAQVSNALGNIHPIDDIIAKAKSVNALTVVDGTQAVAHLKVDVQKLDCDFYVFSGHKMFASTGVGVLYGKLTLLEALPAYQFGGEMVKKVSFHQATTFQPPPLKFEAGTPNIAGVLSMSVAAKFIQSNLAAISQVEEQLYNELKQALATIPKIQLWGDNTNSIATQSFTVEGINTFDLAVMLDQLNISLRAGHHCAMPLMQALNIDGTLRVSLACYNTQQDIHAFVSALTKSIKLLEESKSPIQTHTSVKRSDKHQAKQLGELGQKIKAAKSWDDKYRQIMLAGKTLQRLPSEYHTQELAVQGCESQVWLTLSWQQDKLVIAGDSPSKIVRGLLAIVFDAIGHNTAQQVIDFSLHDYLQSLGLARHLSESRGNGLRAVMEKIIRFCECKVTD